MTDIATVTKTPMQLAVKGRSQRMRVTGKLRDGLNLMVWGDDDLQIYAWDAAARKVGLTLRAMRYAMERTHVRAYLKEQRHVFLASATAKNPRRLVEIRDQDDNRTAAVSAIKQLEEMVEERAGSAGTRVTSPGVTIHIHDDRNSRTADAGMIEINPLGTDDATSRE